MSSSSCHSSEKSSRIHNCWCSFPLEKVTYHWTIDNFSSREGNTDHSKSTEFSASTNDNLKWYLLFKSCGVDQHDGFISVHLGLSPKSKSKKACGEVFFYIRNDKTGKNWFKKTYRHIFDNSSYESNEDYGDDWGFKPFLKYEECFENELLTDDKLTITCELMFFELNDDSIAPLFERCNIDSLENLSEDLASVRKNTRLSDVVFSVSGKEYPAHKVILSARSRVFAAMFNHDMKENTQNPVEIIDMDEDVVEEMLNYLYTGYCANVKERAEDLLPAAEKYDIPHLKKICEESLYENLTTKNAPRMLILADMYHANYLKSKVINFIVAESSIIVNSADWNCIMPSYPLLLNEVCIALSRRGSTA